MENNIKYDMYGNVIPDNCKECSNCNGQIYLNRLGSWTHINNATSIPTMCYDKWGAQIQATPK